MYKVSVVVDPDFGERLAALAPGVPVWIADSPANTPVTHRIWKERGQTSHLTGITTFQVNLKCSHETSLIDVLSTIDLHHGPLSANPPYMKIEVLGASLTDTVRIALTDYGFDGFRETLNGFEATRQRVPPVE